MPIRVTLSNCVQEKRLFVEISQYSQESTCFKVSFELLRSFFLDGGFQNLPELALLEKYQLLLNQSFKYNSAHIPSLNLTPTLSFEPRFRMLNGYDRKSKGL